MEKWIKSLFCLLLVVIFWFIPVPEGLTPFTWHILGLYLGTVLGIVLRPFPEPVILMSSIAILSVIYLNLSDALHAFSSSTSWLILTAFVIGECFIVTGLGKRIAYFLIDKFGHTTLRLGYVATLTDFILSPAIPSNTARSGGLVYPIFQSLAYTLDSYPDKNPKKIGSYFMLLLYQNSLTTGTLFITAGAIMPMMIHLCNQIMGENISWFGWAAAMLAPGIILLLITPYIVYRMEKPELKVVDNRELAKKGRSEIGPMLRKEKILAVLFIMAIIGWGTGGITKISSAAVALGFLSLALVCNVITWKQVLEVKSGWSTFVWYSGIISLSDVLTKGGFFVWLGQWFRTNLDLHSMSPLVAMGILILITMLVRYFFASTIAYVVTFVPVVFTLGQVFNLPPIPLLLLVAASAQLASLLTHYGNAVGPLLFGAGYVAQGRWWLTGHVIAFYSMFVYFVIGLLWWSILGLW